MKNFLPLILAIIIITITASSRAQKKGPTDVYEGFDITPDIASIYPRSHYGEGNLREKWDPIKSLGLESVAVLDGFFHDRTILLAARDSLLIYYSGQLAGTSNINRWKPINISHSGTIFDPHLNDYLRQVGYSNETAKEGFRFLFFDIAISSGLSYKKIKELLRPEYQNAIEPIAIASDTSDAPSLYSPLAKMFPAEFAETLLSSPSLEKRYRFQDLFYAKWEYGVIPQFTGNSLFYQQDNHGAWIPMSSVNRTGYSTADRGVDPQFAKIKTIEWMEDLKYYWSLKETKEEFLWKQDLWRRLRAYADNSDVDDAVSYLETHPKLIHNPSARAAIAIDFANILRYFYSKSARRISEIIPRATIQMRVLSCEDAMTN